MGKALVEAAGICQGVALTAAVVRAHSSVVGMDCGELCGVGKNGIAATAMEQVDAGSFDVWIDFTLPEGAIGALEQCVEWKKPMVIGTTGFSEVQKKAIQNAARKIPLVVAPNMSVGVNVCFELLHQAATMLTDGYDVEIIEAHHRHKKDAPSGTALRMGEVVAGALNRDLTECAVYGRHGVSERDSCTIGFETIRAGDIVGEHTVMFAGSGERVEITHRASSRLTFANGAMRAAAWLHNQSAGLYDMRNVLGLS